MTSEHEDDLPCLSAETFAVLQEFYKEQEEKASSLSCDHEENIQFREDWQLSQFWYNDSTINNLIKIALKAAGSSGKIALISCPSLYHKMKKVAINCEVTLFEFDKRFSIYGKDFVYYDYKEPLSIPKEWYNYYDLVVADPPFLSEECLTKTAVTIRYLSKDKIILCTGAVMADLVERLLDLKKTPFVPKHKNNLANEFWCYSNFEIDIDTL